MAFGQKLTGFKSIRIETGEKPGTQKVTIVTDGTKALTKEDAVKALGDKSSQYQVQEWAEKKDLKSEQATKPVSN